MVTANDSRRCTVARHTPNKRSLRSSFLCRLYRQHFDGPTGSSGSGVDGRFTELDACLPSFELMTPVCRRSPPTVRQEARAVTGSLEAAQSRRPKLTGAANRSPLWGGSRLIRVTRVVLPNVGGIWDRSFEKVDRE